MSEHDGSQVRIAPAGEPLVFVQNTRTGTVHVLPFEVREEDVTRALPGVRSLGWRGAMARTRMLCPAYLIVGDDCNAPATLVDGRDFADYDLCAACVRALGDQSPRAFHPDNRGYPADRDNHGPAVKKRGPWLR